MPNRFRLGDGGSAAAAAAAAAAGESPTPKETKHVGEVLDWNANGAFDVRARVANISYRVYDACPRRRDGMVCRRKLDEHKHCPACGQTAKQPATVMFVRMELEDLREPDVQQSAAMFGRLAERFIGLTAKQLAAMDQADGEEENGQRQMESLLGRRAVFKVNVKDAKNTGYGDRDWTIGNFWMLAENAGADDGDGADKGMKRNAAAAAASYEEEEDGDGSSSKKKGRKMRD